MVLGRIKEWILLHIYYRVWASAAMLATGSKDDQQKIRMRWLHCFCFLLLQACFLGEATKTLLWGSQFFRYINATYFGLHLCFSYFSSYLLDPRMGWEGDKQRTFPPASILETPRSVDSSCARSFVEKGVPFGKWRAHWVNGFGTQC